MDILKLSELIDDDFSKMVNEIYLLTDFNKMQYPNYYQWYYGKNIPRHFDGTGETIFLREKDKILGLSILKKTMEESKICTLLISKSYRRKGLSHPILEASFEFLDTDKPVITIPEKRLGEFSKIIETYGWEESLITDEYNSREVIFNYPKVKIK